MTAPIRDPQTLTALQPLEVVAYLRTHGWRRVDEIGSKGVVWASGDGSEAVEVIVPLDRNLRDFALRMSEVVHGLEVVEGRSRAELIADLTALEPD